MNPSQPSQPSIDEAYTTAGNAADQTPSEQKSASDTSNNAPTTTTRTPHDEADAEPTATALGSGTTDPTDRGTGMVDELDGEQMRAPGEGDVMRAQQNKGNMGMGEQESLTADLDRKKEEQQGKRESVQADRHGGTDVDGGHGQKGGPAAVEGGVTR
ncbi:MAG: hypothetical protein M1833_001582 [Piccolia ochrophora]|nr:MAG: hypothetical protein M1833_001582 [Piccolia ochrophora]